MTFTPVLEQTSSLSSDKSMSKLIACRTSSTWLGIGVQMSITSTPEERIFQLQFRQKEYWRIQSSAFQLVVWMARRSGSYLTDKFTFLIDCAVCAPHKARTDKTNTDHLSVHSFLRTATLSNSLFLRPLQVHYLW